MSVLLKFEQSTLADLENEIEKTRKSLASGHPEAQARLDTLEQERDTQLQKLYSQLTPWDTVQVARHPERLYTLDFVRWACTEFVELHGDRRFGDDQAMVGGPALLDGLSVMLIGNQKGRGTKDNVARNFGQVRPEGFRKAQRLLEQAERLHLPVVTLVDTPGGSTGIAEEERGQVEAIAASLETMLSLRVPTVAVVIGEGGSGGALAISLADRLLILEHAIYSVASPEASAAILWRSATHAPKAAEAMHITAQDLLRFGIADAIIPEPLGGAHRDHQAMAQTIRQAVLNHLHELMQRDAATLLEQRYEKYRRIGTPNS